MHEPKITKNQTILAWAMGLRVLSHYKAAALLVYWRRGMLAITLSVIAIARASLGLYDYLLISLIGFAIVAFGYWIVWSYFLVKEWRS